MRTEESTIVVGHDVTDMSVQHSCDIADITGGDSRWMLSLLQETDPCDALCSCTALSSQLRQQPSK